MGAGIRVGFMASDSASVSCNLSPPSQADEALERRIDAAHKRMVSATTLDDRREAYEDMRWFIAHRSDAQKQRMEERIDGLQPFLRG